MACHRRASAVVLALLGLVPGCKRAMPEQRPAAPPAHIVAPWTAAALDFDGELDEEIWLRAPRSGDFTDEHGPARPVSEARVAWGSKRLFLALYAADENIERPLRADVPSLETDDVFIVRTRPVGAAADTSELVLTATGEARDAVTHARHREITVARDTDGTVGDASDADQEWVLELAIPLATLGVGKTAGSSFELDIERCDTTKDQARRCGSFTTVVTLGTEP